ncbi:O-antigen ligase family protein [Persicirhabdus sediminis]|uniref:O-antigen ligase family protein n=2 Tax=Persicirhabdus sediminis TaxID=454144 RepID=A0A8J7MCH2_9BACT|nr:O-antigen ligase family protein [Persicirhabdus sediminis]
MQYYQNYISKFQKRAEICSYLCAVGLALFALITIVAPAHKIGSSLFTILIISPVVLLQPASFYQLFRGSSLFKWVLVLLGYIFVSVLWGESVSDTGDVFGYFRRVCYVVFFILAYHQAAPVFGQYRRLAYGLLIIACIGISHDIIQFLIDFQPQARLDHYFSFIHANHSVRVYGLAAFFMLLLHMRDKSIGLAGLDMSLLVICFTAVLLTSSRGGILGVLIMLAMYILLMRDKRVIVPILALMVAFGCYFWLSSYAETSFAGEEKRILTSAEGLVDRKDSGRIAFWQQLLGRMHANEYIFGKGLLANDACLYNPLGFPHSHSVYLAAFFHGGFFGLFLLISVSIKTLVQAGLELKHHQIKILLLLGLGGLPLCVDGRGVVDVVYKFSPDVLIFWIPVGMAIHNEFTRKETLKTLISQLRDLKTR